MIGQLDGDRVDALACQPICCVAGRDLARDAFGPIRVTRCARNPFCQRHGLRLCDPGAGELWASPEKVGTQIR